MNSVTSTIEAISGGDLEVTVALLHECLTADVISQDLFVRKVLLDPNFDSNGAFAAKHDGQVIGFLLAIARRHRLEDGPDDRSRGYITLFAVGPSFRRKGLGTLLLDAGLHYLRERGCGSVHISPYAPDYWMPGVDVEAYPGAVAFLETAEFETTYSPLAMSAPLDEKIEIREPLRKKLERLRPQHVRVESYDPIHAPQINDFLRNQFPGDWQRYVRETMMDILMRRRPANDLLLAFEDDLLVGFAQHEGERFGPFGVATRCRGRGIGTHLLLKTMKVMEQKGLKRAWFMWTDDTTAERVYAPLGFRETRRFAVMSRTL